VTRWRDLPSLSAGIALLDAGEAHAAHDAFEAAWHARGDDPEGQVARALAQWSAACVHATRGRSAGFASLALKCARALAAEPVAEALGTRGLAAWIEDRARNGPGRMLLPARD
jgi:predicted metal-dependent hydrolase